MNLKAPLTIGAEMAQGGGDVGLAGLAQAIDLSMAQRCYGMSGKADPTLTGVFAPSDSADILNLMLGRAGARATNAQRSRSAADACCYEKLVCP
jgi:hypothetical protein